MNKVLFDLFVLKALDRTVTQRALAKSLCFSLGKIHLHLTMLKDQNFLTPSGQITSKGSAFLEQHRPKRAIILAAGMGLNLMPLNDRVPKGLIEVRGERLIERLLRQLNAVDIYDIKIVVGHLKEAYDYLIDAFGVELIVNHEYVHKENWYSLYLVRSMLEDAYVLPCNVWFEKNPFRPYEDYSWYALTNELSLEGSFSLSKQERLITTPPAVAGYQGTGLAYIASKDLNAFKERLNEIHTSKAFWMYTWEEALFLGRKHDVYARIIPHDIVHVINRYEQLIQLDEASDSLQSPIMSLICDVFNTKLDDIHSIRVQKRGMTNRSFTFILDQKSYIVRVPGKLTHRFISRRHEYAVLETIKPFDFVERNLYFSKESGVKIARFYEGARVGDAQNEDDVKKMMALLKHFHSLEIKVSHTFNIRKLIETFVQMRHTKRSVFQDYQKTKEKIYHLIELVESLPTLYTLCHIDPNHDNFLFTSQGLKLIDWEYAGMQDTMIDLAMFAIYAHYNQSQTDRLLDIYFEGHVPNLQRFKVYAYMAIGGFLWTCWSEYKASEGYIFRDYVLIQYRYAKTFYQLSYEPLKRYKEET